jgi:replicative DNA helicase
MLNETRLLHKAIAERSLSEIFTRGVTDSWFDDESDRRLFIFIRQYFANYNGCPSVEAVKDNFPNFELTDVADPITYLLDAVVSERRKKATISMLAGAIRIMDKDKNHESALLELQGGLIKIEEAGFSESRDIDLTVDPEKRYDEYLSRKNTPDGILGYRTGFPTIDNTISGIQKGQLIVVAALPKTGKSTLCMQMAITQHEAGNAIMFKSFEMSNNEQASRYDAMRSKLSHHRLITGTMTPEEESRYASGLRTLSKFKSGFKLVDSGDGRTVTSIANKIQLLQPDVVYIDGVYLMVDEQTGEMNTPQALTNITRSLKNLAQKTDKPIVINTQYLAHKVKSGRATLDSIGYASSFAQDADVVMGLERIEDGSEELRWLRIMASRNSGGAEVGLAWEWDRGIFREIDKDDLNVTD